MSGHRLFTDNEQIDKLFKSMHEYKEEIHKRYLKSLENNDSFSVTLSTKNERK